MCVYGMEKFHRKCMQNVIAPVCKNKNGDISDAGNYRLVSLAAHILSCISPL